MSYGPNLEINATRLGIRGLVIKSANWSFVFKYGVTISLLVNLSWAKWQLTFICFVRSWNTRFLTIWIATWLSQKSFIGVFTLNFICWGNLLNHISLKKLWGIARYIGSAVDLTTTASFVLFHVTRFPSRNVQ